MSTPDSMECSGCLRRDARIAELEAALAERTQERDAARYDRDFETGEHRKLAESLTARDEAQRKAGYSKALDYVAAYWRVKYPHVVAHALRTKELVERGGLKV
jgi:hypothetical protein